MTKSQIKEQFLAVVKIGEKIAMLAMGATAVSVSVLDPRFQTLKTGLLAVGIICLFLALVPMIWAYIKNNWPKK